MATKNKAVSIYLPLEVEEYLTDYCQEYNIMRKNKAGEEKAAHGTAIVRLLNIFASLPSDIEEYLTRYCKEYSITFKDREGKDKPDLGAGLFAILRLFISNNRDNLPSPLPAPSEDIAIWQQHQEKQISELSLCLEQLNTKLSSVSNLSSSIINEELAQLNSRLKQVSSGYDRLLSKVTDLEEKSNLPSNVVTKDELPDLIDNTIAPLLTKLKTELTEKIDSLIVDRSQQSFTSQQLSENNNSVIEANTKESTETYTEEISTPETNKTKIIKPEVQAPQSSKNKFIFEKFASKYKLTISQKEIINNGVTDKQLGQILRKNHHSIRRLRTGETKKPNTREFKDILKCLQVRDDKWYPKC